MIYEKIESARVVLGELAGEITEEQWALVSLVRAELRDAMQQVRNLEESLTADLVRGFSSRAARGATR